MPIRAVLFDFDGVIADSLPVLLEVFADTAAGLGYRSTLNGNSLAKLENVTYEEIVRIGGIPAAGQQSFLATFFTRFAEGFEKVPLFVGIERMLQTVSSQVPIAIVSAGQTKIIVEKLFQHNLLSLFEEIYGGDTGGTKTDNILHFANSRKIPPKDILMVGDSVSDITKGKAAEAQTAAVTWGWQPKDRLIQMRPDYLLESVDELASLMTPTTEV